MYTQWLNYTFVSKLPGNHCRKEGHDQLQDKKRPIVQEKHNYLHNYLHCCDPRDTHQLSFGWEFVMQYTTSSTSFQQWNSWVSRGCSDKGPQIITPGHFSNAVLGGEGLCGTCGQVLGCLAILPHREEDFTMPGMPKTSLSFQVVWFLKSQFQLFSHLILRNLWVRDH